MATSPSPEHLQVGSPLAYWPYFVDGSPSPDAQARRSRAVSPPFAPSRLNPKAPAQPPMFNGSRAQSRQSMIFNRVPSEESQALASHPSAATPNRTSMLLYRVADADEQPTPSSLRQSVISNSGSSTFNVSSDSKYPTGTHTPHRLIPYPFDPSLHIDTPEDDDALHDPLDDTPLDASSGIAIRGFINIGVLILVVVALLFLFIFYPVYRYVIDSGQ